MRLINVVLVAAVSAASSVASMPIVSTAHMRQANEQIYSALVKRRPVDYITLFGTRMAPGNRFVQGAAQEAQSAGPSGLLGKVKLDSLTEDAKVLHDPSKSSGATVLSTSPQRAAHGTSEIPDTTLEAGSKRTAPLTMTDGAASDKSTGSNRHGHFDAGTQDQKQSTTSLDSPSSNKKQKQLAHSSAPPSPRASESPIPTRAQGTAATPEQRATPGDVSSMSRQEMQEEIRRIAFRRLREGSPSDPDEYLSVGFRLGELQAALRGLPSSEAFPYAKVRSRDSLNTVLEAVELKSRYMRLSSDARKRGEGSQILARLRALPQEERTAAENSFAVQKNNLENIDRMVHHARTSLNAPPGDASSPRSN